ncbi:aspartyl protease family protein At5g10770-like [Salvia miltiorrhiza]|uniref:aspartyl protease family protein At5g10770-like n=1 Tax=Salvia miltiorrhiza TaxID=226208 RepID=UPI0025AC1986|nr:aspartyl protease family protein At5g10770-like [Salvia miltiorrhiza]
MASLNVKMRICWFLFTLISCFVERSSCFESRNDESHFHIVEISSFSPADVCTHSTINGFNKRQSSMEILHRQGPCFQQGQNKAYTSPSLDEVLSHDQARVESIQARIDSNSNTNTNTNKIENFKWDSKKANLPVESGRSLGSGNYIVTVGLGTPKRSLSLMFDTGSDLTWTQCQPCVRSCYHQQEPIFNPSTSSSYKNISCKSAECSQLSSATGSSPGCATTTCVYGIQYGDQSFSVGYFSRDKLTISATDVFPSFLFGCGQNNQGLFGNTAGLLGLGRNALSIVSQTASKYGKYFSYCLPSTSSHIGHLTLGKGRAPTRVKFTPLDRSQGTSFYFIDIVSISVGGRQLPIRQPVFQAAGGIIDSGTVITRLPPAAYSAMSAAFRKLMTKYPKAPAYSILDTCYDLSRHTSVSIPIISFTFGGNVKLDLDPTGILVAVAKSRLCLAFAGNIDASNVAIYGNTQQKTFEVVYDVGAGKVGFAPGGCK